MQSGLWKQWSRNRVGALYLAGMALAVVSVSISGTRLHAESIPTETQLRVESSVTGNHTSTTLAVHVEPVHAGGVVTLLEGKTEVGSATLDDEGNAKVTTTGLAPGAHDIHAVFAGSALDSGSTLASSTSTDAHVTADATGVADFSIAAKPTSLSVVKGSTVSTTVTLTPLNSFSGYVTLSCSQLTASAVCTFVPANVYVSGTAGSPSTLSVETYGVTTSLRNHSNMVYAFLLPGMLGLAGLGLRGRKSFQCLGILLLAVAFVGGTGGCAQRYHYLNRSPQASQGTSVGSSTFIIEAQSISGTTVITHQISVALTVTAPTG